MLFKVFTLVWLFVIRLRFPPKKSIAEIIRKRYGDVTVKAVRKFEKLDFKRRKALLDKKILETCAGYGIIPRFLEFRKANKTLRKSKTYAECQNLLLNEEIVSKSKKLETLNKNFGKLKKDLHSTLSYFDFLYVTSLFFEPNKAVIEKIEIKQNIKIKKLLEKEVKHDPKDIIYNYSSHVLTEDQESLLIKGLNFALPPRKLRYENYLLPFELLYRDVSKENIKEEDVLFAKTELRSVAYNSFKMYNKKDHRFDNITKDEQKAFVELRELVENNRIIIQKADKGNVVVILDKEIYVNSMTDILSDNTKFVEVKLEKKNKELDYLLEVEGKIVKFLKELRDKGSLTDIEFKKLKPCGSQPGVLYGLCKVHKGSDGVSPPFRPILSAINTPSFNIAKFLVPLLSDLTKNQFVSKDSFAFAEVVRKQNSQFYMASFDIDSLFTNLPLNETIDLCVDKTFLNKNKHHGLSKSDFRCLLNLAVKDAFFLFNGKYYIQLDGVAMGSPLGPTLANVFLCHWEEIWLKNCPKQFSPQYYNRFMDDTFLLFSKESHVKKFLRYIDSRHKNMSFTYEVEKNNSLAFLDVLVTRKDNLLVTSLYRKPTFSGLYMNFNSFLPDTYKEGLIKTLLHRAFVLCFSWEYFHKEVEFLKNIFHKNQFPEKFTDKCIKEFLDKIFVVKRNILTVPQKEFCICLPFLGSDSCKIRKQLIKFKSTFFSHCKLKVVFSSGNRLRNSFMFKDKVPFSVRSYLLYRYTCNRCNSVYLGKTKRHYLVRVFEHLGVSLRTGKKFSFNARNINNSAILTHINTQCKHSNNGSIDDFSIIGSAKSDQLLCIKESLLIQNLKPKLNASVQSTPLQLFD